MLKESKKVSIIIPTYKRAKYIKRAIKSILQQTYNNFEIIVVDDNNQDTKDRENMESLMQEYKENDKIIYIKHEKNRNGAAARNTGIAVAKGDYITFLDDDDYFLRDRLKILVNELEENKEYNAAFTGVIFTKNKKIMKKLEAKNPYSEEEALLKQEAFFGTGSNMFLRTEAVKQLEKFDETFLRNQDFEFMVRYFSKNNKILAVNKYLVVKTNDNVINIPNIDKTLQIREKYLNKFNENIKKFNKTEIYRKNYLDILYMTIQNKDWNEYKIIKRKVNDCKKMTVKERIYIIMLFLNSFNIIKLLRKPFKKRKHIKLIKSIDSKVMKEIEEIEAWD